VGDLGLVGDEATGADIVRRAIEAPLRQLAANAGVEGALIVAEVKKGTGNHGYNVATGKYEDLIAAGVVDPAKVTRSALQNAASISGLLLDHRVPHRRHPQGRSRRSALPFARRNGHVIEPVSADLKPSARPQTSTPDPQGSGRFVFHRWQFGASLTVFCASHQSRRVVGLDWGQRCLAGGAGRGFWASSHSRLDHTHRPSSTGFSTLVIGQ